MKVRLAFLHAAAGIPSVFNETSLNLEKVPGIRMWWSPGDGLYFNVKGKTGMTSAANIKTIVFEDGVSLPFFSDPKLNLNKKRELES